MPANAFIAPQAGGALVQMPINSIDFGCRVVPNEAQIRAIDQWWFHRTKDAAPGKHCALTQLLEHHNSFMALTAFRLALLFALRERRQYVLCADVDERMDCWLAIDDKHVAGRG
ncbi:MAG: hypothetical protein Q7K57_13730 [Burkholderiaceae bacterium]|nr:hypothetical protein [Burkholderiaceae bacterium]